MRWPGVSLALLSALFFTPALSLALTACFEPPPPLAPRDAAPRDAPARARTLQLSWLAVQVRDASGREHPLDEVPRRPVIELGFDEAIVAPEESILLLEGALSDDVQLDAERRPFTRATLARSLEVAITLDAARVRLEPARALVPDASYTLVIAAFTRSASGSTLGTVVSIPLRVSSSEAAGARLVGSFPAEGAADVPTNLTSFVFAFDGAVELVEPPQLFDALVALPSSAQLAPCEPTGFDAASCLVLRPRAPLPAARTLVVEGARLVDATGASVPLASTFFTTALGPDLEDPALVAPSACPIDAREEVDRCVVASDSRVALRLSASEAVRAELRVASRVLRSFAPRGSFELLVDGLAPGSTQPATLQLTDLVGRTARFAWTIETSAPLAPLTITEVCSNPVGPEPQQEWIELGNVGDVPASLEGLAISDRADTLGTSIPSSRVVVPGARVLLVGEGFDPERAGVPAGTPLVVVGRTIVPAGIANAGEPLYLRDAEGRRLAHVPALPGLETSCLVRIEGRDPRADDASDFDYDACTPGR